MDMKKRARHLVRPEAGFLSRFCVHWLRWNILAHRGVRGVPGAGGGKGVQRVWGNLAVPPDPLARAERKRTARVAETQKIR